MKFFIIFSSVLVVGIILWIVIVAYEKKQNAKVMASSRRIAELVALNQATQFHPVQAHFEIMKRYDNKSNFNKIEPAYLMTAEIRAQMGFFSVYVNQIRENRNKLLQYQNQIQAINANEHHVDYASLKISEAAYQRREKRLFTKKMISPVVDCTFSVTMSYSSPKGRVNLSKKSVFSFDDLFACFESVSRSRLDKRTYSNLAAVERGEVSDSLRYDILNRDNFTCVICGASARQGARLHVDHIVPIAKGGKSVPDNLRTLCERCNIGKSDKIEAPLTGVQKDEKEEAVCGFCGAKLVLRKGKYGDFYGCANYPSCKFTKHI